MITPDFISHCLFGIAFGWVLGSLVAKRRRIRDFKKWVDFNIDYHKYWAEKWKIIAEHGDRQSILGKQNQRISEELVREYGKIKEKIKRL